MGVGVDEGMDGHCQHNVVTEYEICNEPRTN
jgi:hypothetical protein